MPTTERATELSTFLPLGTDGNIYTVIEPHNMVVNNALGIYGDALAGSHDNLGLVEAAIDGNSDIK